MNWVQWGFTCSANSTGNTTRLILGYDGAAELVGSSQKLSSKAFIEVEEQKILQEEELPWKLSPPPHNLTFKDFCGHKIVNENFWDR